MFKDIRESPFKPLKWRFYLGKIKYHTPYFLPINFNKNIISFRKLKLLSPEEVEVKNKRYPHLKDSNSHKFSNYPLVHRAKSFTFKLFDNYYLLEIGTPIILHLGNHSWKCKFNSPRHEWNPHLILFFFRWQFCFHWIGSDNYWEQFLWWRYYSDKDIVKSRETWGWTSNGVSTWNNKHLKNK